MKYAIAKRKKSGFTLIELLVAVSLMLILIGAIVLIFGRATKIFNISEANMTVMQNARVAFDLMSKEIAGAQGITAIPASSDEPVDGQTLLTFQTVITAEDVTGLGTVSYVIFPVANSGKKRWRLFRKFSLDKPDGTTAEGQDLLCQFIHAERNGVPPGIDFALATYIDDEDPNRWEIPKIDPGTTTHAVRIRMDVTDIKSRIVRTVSRIFWVAKISN